MGGKEKFRCQSCNWRFMQKSKPNLCPYCGKNKVEVDTTLAADELLNEL